MKRAIGTLIFGVAMLASASGTQAQTSLGDVSVADDATSRLTGEIVGDGYASAFIEGRAGQVLSVSLEAADASVNFNVLPEGDPEAIYIGSIYGPDFVGALPVDGRYEIRVYQMGAAADEGEDNAFTLEIGLDVEPLPAPEQEDALVDGTSFHATGELACSFEADPDWTACPFGVTRTGGGAASVFATTPSGFVRQLDFAADGSVSTPQGDAELTQTREEDNTVIALNGSEEAYTVPDVVIQGD